MCEFDVNAAFSCILPESWPNWLLEHTLCDEQSRDSVDVNCCENLDLC